MVAAYELERDVAKYTRIVIADWKGTFVQRVLDQFHNEFYRSVSDPRGASSGIGKSHKLLTDARHYAAFESEINKPNR